ncbi:hypothetical protein ABIE27_005733 [Paenibacillus sp. 4624]
MMKSMLIRLNSKSADQLAIQLESVSRLRPQVQVRVKAVMFG